MLKSWLILCLVACMLVSVSAKKKSKKHHHHHHDGELTEEEIRETFDTKFWEAHGDNMRECETLSLLKNRPHNMAMKRAKNKLPPKKEMQKFRCHTRGFLKATNAISSRLNWSSEEACVNFPGMKVPKRMCSQIPLGRNCPPMKVKRRKCDTLERIYRNIDGTCNNLRNPTWGSAEIPFRRLLCPIYGEDNTPRHLSADGSELPSPRKISVEMRDATGPSSTKRISRMVFTFGQFVDHDTVRSPETAGTDFDGYNIQALPCCDSGKLDTSESAKFEDCAPINVMGDPFYKSVHVECIPFIRSLPADNGCVFHNREQTNEITIFIDGSNVYASDNETAQLLRSFEWGRLNESPEYENGSSCPVESPQNVGCPYAFLPEVNNEFIAGDGRVNENSYLTSMHTLWLRVHNTITGLLHKADLDWDDEKLYQETRRMVYSLMQNIIYGEFLPVVLGSEAMKHHRLHLDEKYKYDAKLDATAINSFSAAAFRFGHTLVTEDLTVGEDTSLPLVDDFFKTGIVKEFGTYPSDFMNGLASKEAEIFDSFLVPTLGNQLFADEVPQGQTRHGFDLFAINIMRGRDHGIPPYNQWRELFNLGKFCSFEELKGSDIFVPELVDRLKAIYRDVDDVDLFTGGTSEIQPESEEYGVVGPTFRRIISEQFFRIKFGDRFWFQNQRNAYALTEEQITAIRSVTLSEILCVHTSLEKVSPNAFLLPTVEGNEPILCSDIRQNSIYPEGLVHYFAYPTNDPTKNF